ncbi:hypothetical protein GDO86_002425 [Hymenochirus boettgeri]|uniref:Molybdopterin synthase sulfur carrier subunit n=1 Tax=Hymenochirus boettgeri TaxID=247094 RepID=A0A8T2KIC5_9PIPI|nr:hypothetical protein GDO86_002425 [Hymenochirus boettgeri]
MSCEVLVLYFAKSSELTGVRSETLKVPQEITSQQLWDRIVHFHPSLCAIRNQVVLAVCQEYVAIGEEMLTLKTGDEVAVIPPISGG